MKYNFIIYQSRIRSVRPIFLEHNKMYVRVYLMGPRKRILIQHFYKKEN